MAEARRRTGMRAETREKRVRILDAALRTFGAKGYTNASLADIAEQVDMTHAGVLHHFGSKHALLLEVLQHRDTDDVVDLPDQHMPDGIELFRHLVRTAFVNARRAGIVQAYAVLSAESVTEGNPGRPYFTGRFRTLRDETVRAFTTMCAEQGTAVPEDVELAAAAILAVMDGLQVQWLLDPDRIDLGRASARAIEAIVASVLGPRTDVLGPWESWAPDLLELVAELR
ncbi:TetR/AcrR family transcriptional regulator [Flavimobilis sp. GY10621]|uniref:TetR/AcrR family transcriptional regulator n=1 Tax=Flavimobilis rhizosphaerae TaxID=2775421 RepID=A0ABR9DN27_9MICO|nr:TetR/AcrR family transcriptional regulator [Flavimobilis rhizosphaerae]MBD9698364.1 TetR/AcrR family transcriptional regulator [Flavimobilis rhizosphaerae]